SSKPWHWSRSHRRSRNQIHRIRAWCPLGMKVVYSSKPRDERSESRGCRPLTREIRCAHPAAWSLYACGLHLVRDMQDEIGRLTDDALVMWNLLDRPAQLGVLGDVLLDFLQRIAAA